MSDVKNRLISYISHKGISVKAFEERCDLSNGYVSSIRKSIGPDKLSIVLSKYPDLNRDWLLYGEGEMLNKNEAADKNLFPHLPAGAEAGFEGGFSFAIESGDCEMKPRVPNFPKYDMTMTVQGDSMEPEFMSGDVIAIRRVSEFVEWGRPHVIDTQDGAKLKKIYEDPGKGYRCVSLNPAYPEFTVPQSMVNGIYKVVGLLRNL